MNQIASVISTEQGLLVKGDLVYATVSAVVGDSTELLEKHQGESISIDCENIEKLDSAGIALLLQWKRWCVRHQKEFRIIAAGEKATSLISTYKLNEVLGYPPRQ